MWIRSYTSIFHVDSCGHACIIARKSTERSRRCIFSSRYLRASHAYIYAKRTSMHDILRYWRAKLNRRRIPRVGVRLCIYAKSARSHMWQIERKSNVNRTSYRPCVHVSRMHILNLKRRFVDPWCSKFGLFAGKSSISSSSIELKRRGATKWESIKLKYTA